jgi:uncharacterized membrane protein YedE/YeeE
MENFTPWSSLAGGLLIGAAATWLLLLNGRIAGVSNIVSGLFPRKPGDVAWRVLFLAGLVAGAGLYYGFAGNSPAPRLDFPGWLLAVAGLLVGFGTSFGSGCTSGHGVCGLGRLSLRSLVATVIFLATGIVTTTIVRHMFGVY